MGTWMCLFWIVVCTSLSISLSVVDLFTEIFVTGTYLLAALPCYLSELRLTAVYGRRYFHVLPRPITAPRILALASVTCIIFEVL